MQQYTAKVQIESERPILHLDSVHFHSNYSLEVDISNNGKRSCIIKNMTLILVDNELKNFFFGTSAIHSSLAVDEKIQQQFDKIIPDSLLESDPFFLIKFEYKDAVINKTGSYSIAFSVYEEIKKNSRVDFSVVDDPILTRGLEEFARTRDIKKFLKLIASLAYK